MEPRRVVFIVAVLAATGCEPAAQPLQLVAADGNPLLAHVYAGGPPTVVVLHGGPSATHEYLVPEWRKLAPEARVVFYDQRGCGEGPRQGPFSWRQHVRDLDTLVAQLSSGPVVVAGSSWGAMLGLLYALEHPQRVAALLLSGMPEWPDAVALQTAWDRYHVPRAAAQLDSLEQGLLPIRVRDADGGNVSNPRLARRLRVCWEVGHFTMLSLRDGPDLRDFAAVRAPALVVRGAQPADVSDGSLEVAQILPCAEVVTVPGAGHDPWFEQPRVFIDLVRRFLRTFEARCHLSAEPGAAASARGAG